MNYCKQYLAVLESFFIVFVLDTLSSIFQGTFYLFRRHGENNRGRGLVHTKVCGVAQRKVSLCHSNTDTDNHRITT